MQKSKFAAIIATLSLTACSIMSPSVSYEQKLQPWIGKSAEQLYDTLGTPAQTTPIDNNTIMVTYNQITNSPIDGDFEPRSIDTIVLMPTCDKSANVFCVRPSSLRRALMICPRFVISNFKFLISLCSNDYSYTNFQI